MLGGCCAECLLVNSPEKANTSDKCPSIELAESKESARIHVVVDYLRVLVAGYIVKSPPDCPVHMGKIKSFLQIGSQVEICRETMGIRRSNHLLMLIDNRERIARAPFQRVSKINCLKSGQRSPCVGEDAIRGIPRQRTAVGSEKQRIEDAVERES